jgi:hypothetical protein
MQGVFVNGKMEDIQFKKIQLTNNAILHLLVKRESTFQSMTEITVQNYSDFFFYIIYTTANRHCY